MKYTKSQIMRRAHEIRKAEEAKYGWNAKPWGACLKQAWAQAKNGMLTLNGEYVPQIGEANAEPVRAAKTVWGYNIPLQWCIEKEIYRYTFQNNMPFIPEEEVVKETRKAILVQGSWFPKSVCEYVKVQVAA